MRTCQQNLKQGRPVMPARDVLARDYKLVRLGHDETIKSNSDGIGFFYMDVSMTLLIIQWKWIQLS